MEGMAADSDTENWLVFCTGRQRAVECRVEAAPCFIPLPQYEGKMVCVPWACSSRDRSAALLVEFIGNMSEPRSWLYSGGVGRSIQSHVVHALRFVVRFWPC